MNQLLRLALAGLLALAAGPVAAQKVTWTTSTAAAPWQTASTLRLQPATGAASQLTVYPDRPQQRMDGFGGCLN